MLNWLSNNWQWLLICIYPAIFLIGLVISKISNLQRQAKEYAKLRTQIDKLVSDRKEFEAKERGLQAKERGLEVKEHGLEQKVKNNNSLIGKREEDLEEKIKYLNSTMEKRERDWEEKVKYDKSVIEYLAYEKAKGFPWLAEAYDEYYKLVDARLSDSLQTKLHPALKSAEIVRQISKERREAEKAARESKYLLNYCMGLAPWLEEYIGIEADELDKIINEIHSAWEKKEEEFDEEVKHNYGPKYDNLTSTEKLQKKLDWWWEKPNKTDWQIGREYERYIGYLRENKGWDVYYHGKKGFEDLGRDLICKKGETTEIIQCKRWAQEKEIHEKHIYYLFGTTVEYFLEHFENTRQIQLGLFSSLIQKNSVIPKLVTTANLSLKAE